MCNNKVAVAQRVNNIILNLFQDIFPTIFPFSFYTTLVMHIYIHIYVCNIYTHFIPPDNSSILLCLYAYFSSAISEYASSVYPYFSILHTARLNSRPSSQLQEINKIR